MSEETRLKVPFITNAKLDCGPVAVAMVAQYFGLSVPLEQVQQLVVAETSGATWTIGLAAAAAEIGLSVRMFSRSLGVNTSSFELEYYRENAAGIEETSIKLETLTQRCLQHGGKVEERAVSSEELFAAVQNSSVPIVLLDWGKVIGNASYIGHFVPMVGFSSSNVLVHNPGPANPFPYMPIDREVFEVARKATGTDEDVLIIDGLRR